MYYKRKGFFEMKSFCIKNNNEEILNYLINEFNKIEIDDVYISKNEFKYYKNIIVHYIGKNEELFIIKASKILTNCVLKFYEKKLIKRIVNTDYFYFTMLDREYIYANCEDLLQNKNTNEYEHRIEKILLSFVEYIKSHKYFILDGFVNFRLFEYKNILSEAVDIGVNKYIVDKEYKEFIQLLQGFVNSQPNGVGTVHVIYSEGEPIILDEKQNVILYDKNILQPKYLSDISFSSNDYCLNELLNLLPKKIILHLLVEADEFVNTLQLIFKGRIVICKECNICKTFELIRNFK